MKQGDIGTEILFTIKDQDGTVVDLTLATDADLFFRCGTGVTKERAMEFVAPGTSGQVRYITEADDFTQLGNYDLEVRVTFSPTEVWKTSTVTLAVEPAL